MYRRNFYRIAIILAFFALLSCWLDDGVDPFEDKLTILPLGDSRVKGKRPAHESYRFELWKLLLEHRYEVNFIGPERDLAFYPIFMNRFFDYDHAGVGGAKTVDVLARIDNALANSSEFPDIVLLGIGGNDLLNGNLTVPEIIANINTIIDRLQNSNPRVMIFLEKIAPSHTDLHTDELFVKYVEFNKHIPLVANQQSGPMSKVVVVNMAIDWGDHYLADLVHYNQAGAKEVARRYFGAIITTIEEIAAIKIQE